MVSPSSVLKCVCDKYVLLKGVSVRTDVWRAAYREELTKAIYISDWSRGLKGDGLILNLQVSNLFRYAMKQHTEILKKSVHLVCKWPEALTTYLC